MALKIAKIPMPGHRSDGYWKIEEAVGETFASALAEDFLASWSNEGSKAQNWPAIAAWLTWLLDDANWPAGAPSTKIRNAFVAAMRAGKSAQFNEDLFVDLVELFLAPLKNPKSPIPEKTRAEKHRHQAGVLRSVSGKFALPLIPPNAIANIKRNELADDGIPCLASLTKSGPVKWASSVELEKDLERVLRDAGVATDDMSLDAKMRGVAALNEKRLDRLRKLLVKSLREYARRFWLGRDLLETQGLPGEGEIHAAFNCPKRAPRAGEIPGIATWIHERLGNDHSKVLAVTLRYIVKNQAGVADYNELPARLRQLFLSRPDFWSTFGISLGASQTSQPRRIPKRSRGDQQAILQSFLSLTPPAWNAAFGIIAADTAWNISPILELPVDPFIGTVSQGTRRLATVHVIASFKARAKHDVNAALIELTADDRKFIDDHGPDHVVSIEADTTESREGLGETITSYEVIRLVQKMTKPVRPPHESRLMICVQKAKRGVAPARVPAEPTRLNYWDSFRASIKDDPILGGLPIAPNMIRKTRLDIQAMRQEGNHVVAQALAQNGSATLLQRYLRSPWLQHIWNEHIRVFQTSLEAVMASGVEGIARRFGLSPEEFEERVRFALEAGLGFLGAATSPSPPQSTPAIRFVPTPEALVALHVTRRSIRDGAEAGFPAKNTERWEKAWMPLLARTEAVFASVATSPAAPLARAMVARAEREIAQGRLKLFPLE
jgi:hypothetical protein